MLNYYSDTKELITISIYDNIGRKVASKELKTVVGINTVSFNELLNNGNRAKGLYLVSVVTNERTHNVKMVVE